MKTAVRRVLLMSALLAPGALYALGLGEIKLNSALNQPFDAEIELVSANEEDLGALVWHGRHVYEPFSVTDAACDSPFSQWYAEAGGVAADAGVGRLLVTHVAPTLDPSVSVEEAASVFDGPVDHAAPGLEVDL